MKNEFVPYEQALELKQLGFDEPCFLYYGENNILRIFTINIKDFITNSELPPQYNTCPTYSQTFRWFREKYKISGEISSDFYLEGKDNEWEYNIYQLGKEDDGYVGTINIFKTYEDAEIECLNKLIEIVKKK